MVIRLVANRIAISVVIDDIVIRKLWKMDVRQFDHDTFLINCGLTLLSRHPLTNCAYELINSYRVARIIPDILQDTTTLTISNQLEIHVKIGGSHTIQNTLTYYKMLIISNPHFF